MTTPSTIAADRAAALVRRISQSASELAKDGTKEAFALAGVGILSGHLVKALDRIERLEGDIQLLTDLLAGLENKQ